jgi:hypothetical protein
MNRGTGLCLNGYTKKVEEYLGDTGYEKEIFRLLKKDYGKT